MNSRNDSVSVFSYCMTSRGTIRAEPMAYGSDRCCSGDSGAGIGSTRSVTKIELVVNWPPHRSGTSTVRLSTPLRTSTESVSTNSESLIPTYRS